MKMLEPREASKVVNPDSSMEFWSACEVSSGNHHTLHFIDPRQSASLKEPSDSKGRYVGIIATVKTR